MLSRVADDLYWFGRYLQRAENTARLLSVHDKLVLDLPKRVEFGWRAPVTILGADEDFTKRYKDYGENDILRYLMIDAENPGSIISSLHSAREILRSTRDCTPRMVWEQLNELHYYVQERGEKALARSKRGEFLAEVIEFSLLIFGTLISNMSRDVGFQFMRIGTNIEQADMTTRIIDVRSSNLIKAKSAADLMPFQNIQWMSVLKSLTGYQMFRRHVRTRVNGPNVLRFLLQNREFPRSVVFCLNLIATTLPKLPPSRPVERRVERLRALVLDANIDKLIDGGLHELVDEIQADLARLHEAIAAAYFSA
jgi:uncharacterized alpha-E superfamily protein